MKAYYGNCDLGVNVECLFMVFAARVFISFVYPKGMKQKKDTLIPAIKCFRVHAKLAMLKQSAHLSEKQLIPSRIKGD